MADDESEGESENEVTYWDERAGEDENYLGDGAFRVEQVRGRRRGRSGGIEYLIKWEGYASEENTWEPVENVSDDLIAEWRERDAAQRAADEEKRAAAAAAAAAARGAKAAAKSGSERRGRLVKGASQRPASSWSADDARARAESAAKRRIAETTDDETEEEEEEEAPPSKRGRKEATHASLPPRKRPQGGASSAQAPAAKGLARGGASAASTQVRDPRGGPVLIRKQPHSAECTALAARSITRSGDAASFLLTTSLLCVPGVGPPRSQACKGGAKEGAAGGAAPRLSLGGGAAAGGGAHRSRRRGPRCGIRIPVFRLALERGQTRIQLRSTGVHGVDFGIRSESTQYARRVILVGVCAHHAEHGSLYPKVALGCFTPSSLTHRKSLCTQTPLALAEGDEGATKKTPP